MMKKLFLALAVLLMISAQGLAAAKVDVTLEAQVGTVHYAFELSGEEFAILEYTAPAESAKLVIYGEGGKFSGDIQLPLSGMGGDVQVTVKNLKTNKLASAKTKLPVDPAYAAPESGVSSAKVTDVSLGETPEGFTYSFKAEGTDYMVLKYRNKQESGQFYVFPDENGLYQGSVTLHNTYARTLSTVQWLTAKGTVKKEAEVRKGYQAPPAPAVGEGRLSGLVVCVDPGHQENGRFVTEPMGPGIEGKTAGKGGMAQGKVTMRKEAIVMLELGVKLRDELLRQGAQVVMTREAQDIFHTNIERCQIAEDGGAFIMLRLHADNWENKNKRGIYVYTPLNSDYAKAVAPKEEYKEMGQIMLDAMKEAVGYPLTTTTGVVKQNDKYVGNNWAKMICFLIETGFMSNVQDEHLLSQPVYQQWLAEGMAQGVYEIAVYRGLIQPEE